VIFGIEELYKKYFIEEKKGKEIYDYYKEVIKGYGLSAEYRSALKRAIMTQIYGARKKTKEKYCRKGIKEKGLKEIDIGKFIEYIEETEMNKKRIVLTQKIASIM
jgi:hypothetical protein